MSSGAMVPAPQRSRPGGLPGSWGGRSPEGRARTALAVAIVIGLWVPSIGVYVTGGAAGSVHDRVAPAAGRGVAIPGSGASALAEGCRGTPSAACAPARAPLNGGSGLIWANLTAPFDPAPSERAFAAMAYDPSIARTVLFGGLGPYGTALGDLWQAADGSWSAWYPSGESAPSARWGAAFVYDAADSELVLFGGQNATGYLSDSWTLNSTGWHRVTTDSGPSSRAFAAATYDPAESGLLLFGGASATLSGRTHLLNDTWLFRGGSWVNLSASLHGAAPPSLMQGALGYDPSAAAAVLFGGEIATAPDAWSSSTWQFTGDEWSNLTLSLATSPGARGGAAIAYDPQADGLVLFGGAGATGATDTTFEYGPNGWQNVSGAGARPAPRAGAAMTYEPGTLRAVLFGGYVPGTFTTYGDTWGYGLPPLAVVLSATPTAGVGPLNVSFALNVTGGAAPYAIQWSFGDGGLALNVTAVEHTYSAVGNYSATASVTDATGTNLARSLVIAVITGWQNEHQWAEVTTLTASPGPRTSPQMAYDPDLRAVLLFGGYSPTDTALADTWEFVNNVWLNLTGNLTAAPPGRWGGALTYDPADHLLVLFGGRGLGGFYNDTWGFTAAGWERLMPSIAPSARAFFAMTYDAADGYVLLQGGGYSLLTGGPWTVLNDTWEYRGGSWVNATRSVTDAPPPLIGALSTYDPAVGAVVLFGGSSVAPGGTPGTCYPSGATYLFLNGIYTVSATTHSPPALLFAAGTYDATDTAVIVFGGAQQIGGLCYSASTTYSLSGGDWGSLAPTLVTAPPARDAAGIAFDGSEGVVVLFGGTSNGLYLGDTWVYPAPLNGSLGTTVGNPNGTVGGSGSGNSSGGAGGGGPSSNGTGAAVPFEIGYSISATRATVPFTVVLSATVTGGTAPYNFTWDFGDSSPVAAGPSASHTYRVPGSFDPVLTARDSGGGLVVDVLPMIDVLAAPPANATGTSLIGPGAVTASLSYGLTLLVASAAAVAGVVYAWSRYQRRLEEEGNAIVRDIEETKNPEKLPPRTR